MSDGHAGWMDSRRAGAAVYVEVVLSASRAASRAAQSCSVVVGDRRIATCPVPPEMLAGPEEEEEEDEVEEGEKGGERGGSPVSPHHSPLPQNRACSSPPTATATATGQRLRLRKLEKRQLDRSPVLLFSFSNASHVRNVRHMPHNARGLGWTDGWERLIDDVEEM